MVLKKLLREEEKKEEEEFVELDSSAFKEKKEIEVRIETLNDFADTDRIQELLREGNVIFLRIKKIRERDIAELKRSIDKLRKTCVAMNGDIVGVDEDFLIITPNFARIYRGG
jgi:SepF-like predicted cell division protein (DUF552 family)